MNDVPKSFPRAAPAPTDGGIAPPSGKAICAHEKLRSDGRPHDTGLVRPYRPAPADFADRYIELGQGKEIEEHYRTNWRVIRRWIDLCGGDALRAKRYELSGGFSRPNKRSERAKRYVQGRTLRKRRRKGLT